MKRNTDALLDLAKVVEKANRKGAYDQFTWGETSIVRPGDDVDVSVRDCQTSHCLAGHAVVGAGFLPHASVSPYDRQKVYVDWEWVRKPTGRKFRHTPNEARKILGLTKREATILFSGEWRPKSPLSVPGALRKLAKGASIYEVTDDAFFTGEDGGPLTDDYLDNEPSDYIQNSPYAVKVVPA